MDEHPRSRRREPAFNVPALILAAVGLLLLIQAVQEWLSDETRLRLLLDFAFVPAPWSVALGVASPETILGSAGRAIGDPQAQAARVALARLLLAQGGPQPWSPVTYSLLHGSWMHVGFNCLWLLAFGTPVVKRAGTLRTLALAVAASLGGALAQWLSDPLSVQPTIGISAVVSGLMAAAATFIFRRVRPAWMDALAPARRPDWSFLRDRRVLSFLGVWFAINILFGAVAVPLGAGEAGIAWQAHIGGLLAGLALFPFLDPGGRSPSISLDA